MTWGFIAFSHSHNNAVLVITIFPRGVSGHLIVIHNPCHKTYKSVKAYFLFSGRRMGENNYQLIFTPNCLQMSFRPASRNIGNQKGGQNVTIF